MVTGAVAGTAVQKKAALVSPETAGAGALLPYTPVKDVRV
jgi:hypothetical protein